MNQKEKQENRQLDGYEILRHGTLGEGFYAKVKKVLRSNTNDEQAMKVVTFANWKFCKKGLEIQREISELQHLNIIQAYQISENCLYPKKRKEGFKVGQAVLELAENGELFDYIFYSRRKALPENIARAWFLDLLNGLDFLHNFFNKKAEKNKVSNTTNYKGQQHGDIKPGNLVLNKDFVLKITDFDFALPIPNKPMGTIIKSKATERQLAPEIHKNRGTILEKADLFAAGIVLFIMTTGLMPFTRADPSYDAEQIQFNVNKEKQWKQKESESESEKEIDSDLKDLIGKMLSFEPNNRPTIKEIREHPWVCKLPKADSNEIKAEMEKRMSEVLNQREENRKKMLNEKTKKISNKEELESKKVQEDEKSRGMQQIEKISFTECSMLFPSIFNKREVKLHENKRKCPVFQYQYTVNEETLQRILIQILWETFVKPLDIELREGKGLIIDENEQKLSFFILTESGWMKGKAKIEKFDNEINSLSFSRIEGDEIDFREKVEIITQKLEKID